MFIWKGTRDLDLIDRVVELIVEIVVDFYKQDTLYISFCDANSGIQILFSSVK